MPKAYVTVHHPRVEEGIPIIRYGVAVSDSDLNSSSDFAIRPSDSCFENEERWKEEIVQHCAEHGVKISTGDVIVWPPMVKDDASRMDKTNGITSDNTAVVKEEVAVASTDEQPTILARMMDSLRSMWS